MKILWQLAALIFFAVHALAGGTTNQMVHQSGRQIVDAQGRPLQLRGVNLGGWLLWEGWIFGKGFTSQTAIENKLTDLVGREETARFRSGIYTNFISEADLAKIAALGFNSVRVPINWRLPQNDAGWRVLDQLVDNCEKHRLYVVLDLHAAPGGQSGWFTCDPGVARERLWNSTSNQTLTVALWQKVAQRYRSRTIVAGYDLINEPAAPDGGALVDLYQRIIAAVRAVDTQHLIILEGNKLATDFSMFAQPLTNNLAYSFHLYNWFGDDRASRLAQYRALSTSQNVPMWCGEFGENNYAMIHTTVEMFESPENSFSGWSFWTWKKTATGGPGLVTVKIPPGWQPVINWIGSLFGRKPQPAQADTGLRDFLKAVQLENCQLDQQMLDALKPEK
ncbi:MAG TPA: cellulase family glycosylhydrolase [Verrucomicrobiae bacterium]